MNRKVYDVFMFYNEVDLLEIRLNILGDFVDKFIITEANTTQMGEKRELRFPKERHRFHKFEDKILYNVVDTASLSFPSQWEREVYQKNHTIPKDFHIDDEDIVMFSDLDEIPNPKKIEEVIADFDDSMIYHFAQDLFYFYINYEEVTHSLLAACGEFPNIKQENQRWLGTKLCTYKNMQVYKPDGLRQPERIREASIRVEEGGWHFSYMGGSSQPALKRIREKLAAFSHAAELNKFRYKNTLRIWWKIKTGNDLFGRNAKFRKVPLDDTYPKYLRENKDKYQHLILEK